MGRKKDKARKRDRRIAASAEATATEWHAPPGWAGPAPLEAAELAARLASLATVLQRHLSRADSGDGLTRARLSTLALLVFGGPKTPGQLAAAEGVRPPTMTRQLHAMEADGLVIRLSHPSDGRSSLIEASVEAQALLASGRARQLAPLASAIGELDATERRGLQDAAESLGRLLRETRWEAVDPTA
jgi:DNA-binding MarR family transcriptional regulator